MVIKKILILGLLISTLLLSMYASAPGKTNLSLKQRFKIFVHNGNLTGVGLGCNYYLNKLTRLTIVTGTDSPVTIFWALPYSGNMINFNLKTSFILFSGVYISPGWYSGLFKLEGKLEIVEISKYEWQSGPCLAIGFHWPTDLTRNKIGIELGAAFNLPTKILVVEGNYVLEAKRSEASKGSLFLFLTFIIEF